jgi:hypothetical protein
MANWLRSRVPLSCYYTFFGCGPDELSCDSSDTSAEVIELTKQFHPSQTILSVGD